MEHVFARDVSISRITPAPAAVRATCFASRFPAFFSTPASAFDASKPRTTASHPAHQPRTSRPSAASTSADTARFPSESTAPSVPRHSAFAIANPTTSEPPSSVSRRMPRWPQSTPQRGRRSAGRVTRFHERTSGLDNRHSAPPTANRLDPVSLSWSRVYCSREIATSRLRLAAGNRIKRAKKFGEIDVMTAAPFASLRCASFL